MRQQISSLRQERPQEAVERQQNYGSVQGGHQRDSPYPSGGSTGETQDFFSWAGADTRALKTDFLGATAEASPDGQKDRETGQVAAQSRIKADTDFEKLLELKQEHPKLKQEMTAPDLANSAENIVHPQPEAVTDGAAKADLNDLAQEHALQTVRRRLATNFATNLTLWTARARPRGLLWMTRTIWTSRRSRLTRWNSRPRPQKLVTLTKPPSSIGKS